jgi:hypothetical protein
MIAAGMKNGEILPDDVESADARRDVDAGGVRGLRYDFQPGHAHAEIGGGDRQLNEPGHLLEFFFFDPVQGIEIFHFTGDAAVKRADVEMGNGADTAFAGLEAGPDLFGADTASADQPNTGHYNSAAQGKALL